jgi:hypothetical protein
MNLRKSLKDYSFNQPEAKIERTPLLNLVIGTTSLAFLYIVMAKTFTDINFEDLRIKHQNETDKPGYNSTIDNIIDLSEFRKSFSLEDQIYTRPQFYHAPGLKQEIINKA